MNGLFAARLTIALSTTLLLSWFYLSRSDHLIISYTTYLDTWRAVNFLFVLLAAAESFFMMNVFKQDGDKVRSIFCTTWFRWRKRLTHDVIVACVHWTLENLKNRHNPNIGIKRKIIILFYVRVIFALQGSNSSEDKEKAEEIKIEEGKTKSYFKKYFVGFPKKIEDLDMKCGVYFPMAYGIFIFLYWLSVQVFNSSLQCGGSSCTGLIRIFS